MVRTSIVAALLVATALPVEGSEVYLRDGVTDGDTFYLSNIALTDDDPALQSWVSFSLTKSACQLQIGGENPARASSFDCELLARRHLIETWREYRTGDDSIEDDYLDTLIAVDDAGFLREYVARFFGRKSWQLPPDLQTESFDSWRRENLRGHRPETRIIGSWNYAGKVNSSQ